MTLIDYFLFVMDSSGQIISDVVSVLNVYLSYELDRVIGNFPGKSSSIAVDLLSGGAGLDFMSACQEFLHAGLD